MLEYWLNDDLKVRDEAIADLKLNTKLSVLR
jgi:hypothetical protein